MKKGEETRDRLLRCAEKAFSKKGFYETQVSDIVKLAHVAKGTIYQYFNNKEEIFTTLLETYIRSWEKDIAIDMKDFMGGKPALDYAIDYLRHRLMKTAAFFSENQDRTNIVLRVGIGVNDEFEPIMRKFESKILNVIVHDIELAQRQGHIPKDLNIDLASNAVMGAIVRLNYYLFVINKKSVSKMSIETIAEEGVRLVYSTLRMK
jgi:TetR/AcrR family transcriptional regulator, fatty acid metabolism regulator protein